MERPDEEQPVVGNRLPPFVDVVSNLVIKKRQRKINKMRSVYIDKITSGTEIIVPIDNTSYNY
jgi:hypothetical protein